MPAKVHHIRLSAEERQALEKVSASNHKSAREKTRARILLLCDSNLPFEEGGSRNDTQVAKELTCSPNTVYALRRRAGEAGEHPATRVVVRQEQSKRVARKLDGAGEAHLVALVCSAPPNGFARWTLRLVRERLIELEIVDAIAKETIRQTLKKTRLSLG